MIKAIESFVCLSCLILSLGDIVFVQGGIRFSQGFIVFVHFVDRAYCSHFFRIFNASMMVAAFSCLHSDAVLKKTYNYPGL